MQYSLSRADQYFSQRQKKFLPEGIPKHVRCYDNSKRHDATADCFTVVFTGRYRGDGGFVHLSMDAHPFHSQGIGMHGEHPTQIDAPSGWAPKIGRNCHLGKRIPFIALPRDCRRLVMHDYLGIWDLVPEARDTEIPYSVVDEFVKPPCGPLPIG